MGTSLSLGVKLLGREADHSPPFHPYFFMAWCFVKHGDNFTFTFYILILSSHLPQGVPSGLIPSGFPTEMYGFLISPRVLHSHLTIFDFIALIGEDFLKIQFRRYSY
jgi:hypothetical protein